MKHVNLNRVSLYEKLPLRTPFTVSAFVANACNFKCNYCHHCLSNEKLKELNFKKDIMSFEIFKKLIDDISEFKDKLKLLLVYGNGEPLVNKDIALMIAYAKQKDVADRVEIVTNGVLLTPQMADSLIDSGLDRLRISIQGTSAQQYEKVCGTKINFEEFIENIRYFHSKRKSTEIYIKIIDVALEDKKDEEKFYTIFSPIADSVAVEHMAPFQNNIDYSKLNKNTGVSVHGNKVADVEVCSSPFYTLVVAPDGSVIPCCNVPTPLAYENIMNMPLKDIWESKVVKKFLLNQLQGNGKFNAVCEKCESVKYIQRPEDTLDNHTEELRKKYELSLNRCEVK